MKPFRSYDAKADQMGLTFLAGRQTSPNRREERFIVVRTPPFRSIDLATEKQPVIECTFRNVSVRHERIWVSSPLEIQFDGVL